MRTVFATNSTEAGARLARVTLVAARYMTRFRCLGSACEDNCCHSWRVVVDREHHDALRARMISTAEAAEFAAAVQPLVPSSPHAHALLVLDDHGRCRFLAPAGLCTLHDRYGEAQLPDACAMYPRVIGRIGSDHELVGTSSCPEVARQLLFAGDATELVPVDDALFGRGMVSRIIDNDSASAYEQTLPTVRATALGLLAQRRFPVATRLFFLAFFADRTRALLRAERERIPAEELRAITQLLGLDATLDELARQFHQAEIDSPFATGVVRELLRLPDPLVPAAFQQLRAPLVPFYAVRGASFADSSDESVAALDRSYRALAALPAARAARLDEAMEQYAANQLLRDWYIKTPSLLAYVHGLLLRIAVIRFVVRSHTALASSLDAEAFDALIVRAVYALSRMLEHDAALADRIVTQLAEQGMVELGHAICLLRI